MDTKLKYSDSTIQVENCNVASSHYGQVQGKFKLGGADLTDVVLQFSGWGAKDFDGVIPGVTDEQISSGVHIDSRGSSQERFVSEYLTPGEVDVQFEDTVKVEIRDK